MKGTIQDWEDNRAKTEIEADLAALEALPTVDDIEPDPVAVADPISLLERSTAGWRTELLLLADGNVAIKVQQGFDGPIFGAVIAGEDALDAFEHPYCYVGKK